MVVRLPLFTIGLSVYGGPMENGPVIFLAIAAAIAFLALIAARLLRHKVDKPMPGDDPRNHETHWYGGDGSN